MARRPTDDALKTQIGKILVNIEGFKEHVGEPDTNGCMNWIGNGWHAQGYGMTMIWKASTGKRTMMATHRLAYVIEHRVELVRSQFIVHQCSNHWCCNPDHLILGDAVLRERIRRENKGAKRKSGPRRHLRKQVGRTYKFTDSQLVFAYYHTHNEIQVKYGLSRYDTYKLKYMTGDKGYPWVATQLLSLYDQEGNLL